MDAEAAGRRHAATRVQRVRQEPDDGRAIVPQGVETGTGGIAGAPRRVRKENAMTLLNWVQGAAATALGETLLHSLWEGAAAALALAILLSVVRSSRIRYAAACLAMLVMLTGFGATFYRLMPRHVSGHSLV